MYFWLLTFCSIILFLVSLVIQFKYCSVLPSLNKVDDDDDEEEDDYYYYYH